MTKLINIVKSFTANESGAVASEYAVLLVLIAAVLVTAVGGLSAAIEGGLDRVALVITGAP